MSEHADGPWRITFDTNPDDCNLHCVMCEDHSPHSLTQVKRRSAGLPPRRMNVELIRKVLEASMGRGLEEIIPSTMGEPLLYREFGEILQMCAEFGVKLNLTTNGSFPKLGAREWARRIVPVTSDVKISWNGATRATYEAVMLGGSFDSALANVREFVEVRDAHHQGGGSRCRVTFQLTFLASNAEELPAMVELAADLGVDRVKGHHLWAHFDAIKSLSMRRSPEAIRQWNKCVERGKDVALARGVLLEGVHRLDEDAGAEVDPQSTCPFLGQEVWVAADGRFNPCCAPDAERRALGDFGNLHGRGLLEIWNSEDYLALVSGYRTRDLCRSCNMRRPTS